MICSSGSRNVETRASLALSSHYECLPQMGGGVPLELRILGELKSHRLGGVATLSSPPVPLAVAGSSDKTSSFHHAAHSPFGRTHSGLSDRQRKHGPAHRRCGSPNSCARGTVRTPWPPPPFPHKDVNGATFPRAAHKEGGPE